MRTLTKQIVVYMALAVGVSSHPYYLIIHNGRLGTGAGMAVYMIMWCPGLAALA
jgi:membrane protease YdiL (CAAX protease family)